MVSSNFAIIPSLVGAKLIPLFIRFKGCHNKVIISSLQWQIKRLLIQNNTKGQYKSHVIPLAATTAEAEGEVRCL